MEQIFASAILGILEAIGHDFRGLEMPEIHVFGVISANKQIEFAVIVIIKPDGSIHIQPCWQPGLLSNSREVLAAVIVKQLWLTPFIDEDIFIAVVVIVTPNRTRGNSSPRQIDVSKPDFSGYIAKHAITEIAV